ncbi:MAG: hypothetical protein DRJ09_09645 [Bacteroidetes bacterium]|nr:MAG: hypothetical protein DRJ09_09645 [Bacteroidota bacterium]
MKKGFIAGAITVIIILTVVALFINNTKPRQLRPWHLLPNTPALIIETQHPNKLFEKLKYGNDVWNSLTNINGFKQIETKTEYLDSLLKENNKYHSTLFSNPLLIAFYGDSLHTQTLFVSALGNTPNLENLKQFLTDNSGASLGFITKQEKGFQVLKIVNGSTDFSLTLGFAGDMVAISESESLVLKALETYSNNTESHFSRNKLFTKIQKTAGKHVNTHLYLNGKMFCSIAGQYVNNTHLPLLSNALQQISWNETDLFLRKNELVLNGLSIGKANRANDNLMLGRQPQEQDYTGMLPYNTTIMLYEGFSNFEKTAHTSPSQYRGMNIVNFSKLVGNQVVYASTARSTKEFDKKSFVVIRVNDKTDANKMLYASAKQMGKQKVATYNNYTVSKLKSGNFTGSLLGPMFAGIHENYYLFIDDYLVIGNNPGQLIEVARLYETGKTLDLNENFKIFANRLTATSSLTLFIKTNKLTGIASRFFNKQFSRKIATNTASVENFSGMMLQLSAQPPFIYTSLFVKQSTIQHRENLALWRTNLDDDMVGKPYPVKDHTTGKYNIIVFDKSNHVYLVRHDGVILWKNRLSGQPVSDVYQVDYFKNGKIQYLFNTPEYIYLFDKNGKPVKQYPIKINPSATNGLNVFDYNKKRDYRILLAQSDKRIYNYYINGRKVKGWNNFKMADIVIKPVQHLIANHKDYLIVTDINNHVKIVSRKGKERIKIKGKLNKASNSNFYVNKTNSKGLFITTTTSGKLVYISASGRLRYTDFGKFSPDHFFLYDDFNSDGIPDFIYVDKNKLTVFNRFKKVLFNYTFDSNIAIKPAFFKLSNRKKVLGIVSDSERSIYLFDKNGNISISKELIGETPFTITSLNNNREVNLITGAGQLLLNYKIK